MQAYWQRRLNEARMINGQIEAELEGALAATGTVTRRRYARAVQRVPVWAEQRRFDDGAGSLEIVEPRSPHQLQITIFPSAWGTLPSAPVAPTPVALPARRMVGPLWFRGLVAAMYALTSNVVLYTALVLLGAVDRISAAESLPAVLAITSVLCAVAGTLTFGVLRAWLSWPDTAFRLLSAAALVALLVSFVVTPGATVLGAIVAVLMTGMSLGSELVSD